MNQLYKSRIIRKGVMLLFSGLLLSSCSNDNEAPMFADGVGGLRLQAPSTESVIDIPVITKSPVFNPDPETFPIAIYKGEELVKQFDSFAAMKEAGTPLQLPNGDGYSVKACSYEQTEAKSDQPYFEGIETFRIEEKTVTNVKVVCTFESLGVELKISDRFAELLKNSENYSYSLTVSNEIATHTFDSENTEPIYFRDACDYLLVKVVVKLNGQIYPERTYRVDKNGSKPELGQYYIITLDAGKEKLRLMVGQTEEKEETK